MEQYKEVLEKISEPLNNHGYTFRDPQQAFNDAIDKGTLSTDNTADNFAGHYMYMLTNKTGQDAFKNTNTRRYLFA